MNKAYGDLSDLPFHETQTRYVLPDYPSGLSEHLPIDLHGGYSCSKGAADRYVLDYHRLYGMSTIVLRQSSIYGGRPYASQDPGLGAYFLPIGAEQRGP